MPRIVARTITPRSHGTTDAEEEASGDDFAVRKVPYSVKKSPSVVAYTSLGSATSVFAFAMGGSIALQWGFPALLISLIIGYLVSIPLTLLIVNQTARSSISVDLLARGVGYGFLGSTITALIYAANWIMYAAFETTFLSSAIYTLWSGLPIWVWYLITALLIVPLTWYGIRQINWLQKWSLPVFALGLAWLLWKALAIPGWHEPTIGKVVGASTILPALAVVIANVGIWILLIGDYSRYTKQKDGRAISVITAVLSLGAEFLLFPILGGLMSLKVGSSNPGDYAVNLIGVAGLVWIVITQLRVQEGNYYSGSLSLANFYARVFYRVPGRQYFAIVVGIFAFAGAAAGIVAGLILVLTVMGVFLFAWIGVMSYSLWSRRAWLASGEFWVEHRRGYLINWGWPAVIGTVIACIIGGSFAGTGWPPPYGGIIGDLIGFFGAPLVCRALEIHRDRKTYLLARVPAEAWRDTNYRTDEEIDRGQKVQCGICGSTVPVTDACRCPIAPKGIICSECCSAHGTCKDICKIPAGKIDETTDVRKTLP